MTDISALRQAGIPFIPQPADVWKYPPVKLDLKILRARLQERIDATGMTPRAISLAIGANHSYVSQILNGKGGEPSAGKLRDIARVLDTSFEYLVGTAATSAPVLSEVAVLDRQLGWNGPRPDEPGIPLVGTGDCAEIEVVTEDGETVSIERSSFDPEYHIRFVERPAALRGNRQAYAIFFHGSSMEPRFFAGEIGIADPQRPAGPGDFVVVQLNDGASDDVVTVLVKRLVRQNAREYVLEQYNPPLTFIVPRSRVKHVHRLIPPTEQLLL